MKVSAILRNTRAGNAGLRSRATPLSSRTVNQPFFRPVLTRNQSPTRPCQPSRVNHRLFHSTPTIHQSAAASQNVTTPDIRCSLEPAAKGKGSGTVATITLSNPARLNSMEKAMIHKLTSTLLSLSEVPDLRCVIIEGAQTTTRSPAFTAGANIYQLASLQSYEEAESFIESLHSACHALRKVPVPTIAKIHGLCLGGGLELAAACDFRYATQESTFSMPETKFGIPSVIEARLLANIIGWQKTKEMVFFARFYGAEEVGGWGLVDRTCEDVDELEQTVQGAVDTITSYGPKTMREQKRLFQVWEENDLPTGVEAGVHAFATMFQGGEEPGHYMKEFTERKKK